MRAKNNKLEKKVRRVTKLKGKPVAGMINI